MGDDSTLCRIDCWVDVFDGFEYSSFLSKALSRLED